MWITRFWHKLRFLAGRERFDRELREEIDFHRAMLEQNAVRDGQTPESARLSARHRLGNVTFAREQARASRVFISLDAALRDARYAIRGLRRAPLFAGVAALSLAVGIGANTAAFSLIDRILWRSLPVSRPDQLVIASWGATNPKLDDFLSFFAATGGPAVGGGWTRNTFSWPIFADLRARSHTLRDVIGFSSAGQVNVATLSQSLTTGGVFVSGNYFAALGVGPALGRLIDDDDDRTSGVPSAVISYDMWARVLGRDPAAIGATLHVNGQPAVIVGVMPKTFFGLSAGGMMGASSIDVVLPVRARLTLAGSSPSMPDWLAPDQFWVQVVGRVDSPGDIASAEVELASLVRMHLSAPAQAILGDEAPRAQLRDGRRGLASLQRAYEQQLTVLGTIAALALLMACANVASLFLVRTTTRERELTLRLALGASRMQIARQLLVEAGVLAAGGTALGIGLAFWALRLLVALLADSATPLSIDVTPDARVLGLTAMLAVVTTALVALWPAYRAARGRGVDSMTASRTASAGRRGLRVAQALVAGQIAIAVVLAAGATLLVRSLHNLHGVPLGFDTSNVTLFDVVPGRNGYREARALTFYGDVYDRLSHVPGIASVSLSRSRLIGRQTSNGGVFVDGDVSGEPLRTTYNAIGPGFFSTMRIPLVIGRELTSADMRPEPRVVVLNQSAARRFFGGASPLGHRVRWSKTSSDAEIVGVVSDAKYDSVRNDPPATIYLPYSQTPGSVPQQMSFAVRASGASNIVPAVRQAVADVDPLVPLIDVRTQNSQIDATLTEDRLFASLVSGLGAITIALAGIGLYGLVAYSVTARMREIGIRMALGARRGSVVRTVLGQVAMMLAAGLVVGLAGLWSFTRLIGSQLFGIAPHDPVSLALGSGLVVIAALASTIKPVWLATRIDPIRALRCE